MKFFSLHRICWIVLAAYQFPSEPICPGKIPGTSPRNVAGALLVVPVEISHQGSFDFVVDICPLRKEKGLPDAFDKYVRSLSD